VKNKKDKKSSVIGVRFKPSDRALVIRAAKYANKGSVGEFIRDHLIHYITTILMPVDK